ncbi:hypothetical protein BC939DRAFT_98934 [Gamsiella multidivaricata]|uniref:uncharacterized protein n=1 Tax=Gamsiella multidivaricata TaxID=101098 RepID=UPI0022200FC4|nr:uncharacterized protein BC939DRAFT_98934 [Gamsiella multidivaricata]KAI7832233.1 hypothetical protein BC939DRAFT_98934 [Gamsiella multidivaricata]
MCPQPYLNGEDMKREVSFNISRLFPFQVTNYFVPELIREQTEPLTPSVVTIPFIGIHTPEMTMTTTTTMTMTATATATTTTETNTQNPSDTLSHTISPTPSPASPSSPTLSGSTSPTSTDVPSVTVSVSSVSPSPTSPSSPGVTVTVSLTPLPTLTTTTENGTVSGGPATPTPTPTGTDSTMPTITTTTAQSGSRITTATAITTTAPSSPTTTVHSPTPTITTTTTPHTTTKKHRPTKTTTPWLPSTIEPIGPPKTTQTASPGTSLPDVVIPNMSPKIPSNSFNVHLRFEHVSYAQVIDNGVLAAQLVSFVPAQLGPLLKVDVDQILVLAIRDGSTKANGGSGRRARKRALVTSKNVDDAIMATVAIPSKSYWALNTLVRDTHSALYQAGDTSFGQYIDSSFPLSRNPPANSDQKGSSGTMNPLTGENFGSVDPNAVTAGGSDGSGGSTHGAVIGSLVGLATAAYVGIAMVAVKVWRKKKLREQEERDKLHRSISAPISVQGSSQGWAWHG